MSIVFALMHVMPMIPQDAHFMQVLCADAYDAYDESPTIAITVCQLILLDILVALQVS